MQVEGQVDSSHGAARSMVSPEDQGATFVELFFDLVFVFAITQVTHFAAHHLDAAGLVRSVVVFWMIWWGWTQFTWALNAADTNHHHVRLGTLVSTATAFVMAVSIESAFASETVEVARFAPAYIAVRALGLGLYYRVVSSHEAQRRAVITFAALSIAGLVAVLIGSLVAPPLRIWIWASAILLDLGAAWRAGNTRYWGLNAGHFAERHGLIVIIALGESLIVAASALSSTMTVSLLATAAIAVVMTCLLWWTYFGWVQGVVEEALADKGEAERSRLGRDAYSFLHFPLVCGIVALAVGFEAALQPTEYTVGQTAAASGVGLALFLTATAGALWRAVGCILWNRLLVMVLTLGALTFTAGSTVQLVLGVGCAGLALIVAIEQVTVRRRLAAYSVPKPGIS